MKTVDVIIFGGQSNMQGQTERLSECEVVEGALEYRLLDDTLLPLKNPVGETIAYDGGVGFDFKEKITSETLHLLNKWVSTNVLGAASHGNTCLVPAFCRAYIEQTGASVVAVHAAKGSTEIKEWLPGAAGYDIILKKTNAAISKAKGEGFSIGKVLFVWLQGESDALKSNTKAYYKEKITELANALKSDLGVKGFGIIRVGRFTRDDRDLEIISAQDEVCVENPFFIMLTKITTELNEKPEYMNPEAKGHYSAAGLELIGKVSGEALGKAVKI